eukprot:scaffold6586_cov34-Tisochrysis_lutea.AAC.1
MRGAPQQVASYDMRQHGWGMARCHAIAVAGMIEEPFWVSWRLRRGRPFAPSRSGNGQDGECTAHP